MTRKNADAFDAPHADETASRVTVASADVRTDDAASTDAALTSIFGAGGVLSRSLPGFRFRAQQLAMAQAVARAIASRTELIAEAGTGTGKTFAYLVPALLYGGKERFGETAQVWTGRAFVVGVTLVAYLIALELKDKAGIFELAVRFAFTGFAALAPVMVAALFWKRSNKWGALAAVLWVILTMAGSWYLHEFSTGIAPKPGQPPVQIFPALGDLFLRTTGSVTMYGYLPVVFMCLGSVLLICVVSLVTPLPAKSTIEKYFPNHRAGVI